MSRSRHLGTDHSELTWPTPVKVLIIEKPDPNGPFGAKGISEVATVPLTPAVTNAIYVKPKAAYWFDLGRTRALGINGAAIYSIAQVPVSTPGNDLMYGLEMNLGLGYRNTAEGFFAGGTWGVLWPMGALNRTFPLWQYNEDASAAQILRVYMGVKF